MTDHGRGALQLAERAEGRGPRLPPWRTLAGLLQFGG